MLDVRYEYGYGLSYTTFEYDGLSIQGVGSQAERRRSIDPRWTTNDVDMNIKAPGGNTYLYDDMFDIQVTVKNTGNRDGHEVVQLYLGFPESAGEPPKILRGPSFCCRPSGLRLTVNRF